MHLTIVYTLQIYIYRNYGNLFYAKLYTVEKLTISHVAAARPAQLHHQRRAHAHVHILD